jgi:biopolymer transport protein ExbD
MRRFPHQARKKSRIEIIPMIDVMMFLLVFFVLISINVIPALGIKMNLPSANSVKEEHPPLRVIISISADGTYQLDGVSFSSLDRLKTALIDLKNQKTAEVTKNPLMGSSSKLAVIINGDEQSPLQRLVDVMDMLKSSGIESMTIASKKK